MQTQQDAARQAGEVANALSQQLQGDILIIRNNPTCIQFPDLEFFTSSVGVQIIDLNGMILKRSSNLGPMSVHNYSDALDDIRNGQNHRFYTTNETGTPLLVYSVPVVANNTILGAVQVIKPVGGVQDTLSQISRYLILGTALSLIVAAIVGAFLARRALIPIDTITNTASAISRTKDLSRRLNIAADSSEVGRLAATFNEMLDRIQQLFKTQQRLIADVSHELRTPLTTVQGNIELLRRAAAAGDTRRPRIASGAGIAQRSGKRNRAHGRHDQRPAAPAQADSGAFSSRWDRWNWTRCCSTSFDRRRIAEAPKAPELRHPPRQRGSSSGLWRRRTAAPAFAQSGRQRGQIHAAGGSSPSARKCRRLGESLGRRYGHRHQQGKPTAHLRPLLPPTRQQREMGGSGSA